MRRQSSPNNLFIWRAGRRIVLAFIVAALCGAIILPYRHEPIAGATTSGPAWTDPGVEAVKRINDLSRVQNQPTLLSNLDCTSITYRTTGSNTMRTGCFTPTAYGMVDSDNEDTIFNGTDEAITLLASSPHQVIVPWPDALSALTLDAADTGGSYVGMYKNLYPVLRSHYDAYGNVTVKELAAPPDMPILDRDGHRLIINPQTLAFSDNGGWAVAENLSGSFVRINLNSPPDQLPFAPSFGAQGSPALLKSQVAISHDGHYVAIENNSADSFRVYDMSTCANHTGWQANGCASHDYWTFLHGQIPGLFNIQHVRFTYDGLLSFAAYSTNGAVSGTYELTPSDHIGPLSSYLGLGDSYSSGEGAFNYRSGTDTPDNTCHLSVNSYPQLLSRDVFRASGGHSVACSGAVMNDIGSVSPDYKGQVKDGQSLHDLESSSTPQLDDFIANFSPGYIPQRLFSRQYQPAVMTVGIGGNDIGFGDILQKCVMPHVSLNRNGNTCYSTYESRLEIIQLINRTIPKWIRLYEDLKADSPESTIYAIGYPSIASETGRCGRNVNLNKSELEFAQELVRYLNASIGQAAQAAGVSYVDITDALIGHRLCEASDANIAVNGLTAGNDFGAFGVHIIGRESYHPNALGQELMEQAILRQTGNLPARNTNQAPTTSGADTANLLEAPKTGRPVSIVVPDRILTRPLVQSGNATSLRISGTKDGLAPGTPYVVRLDGPDGIAVNTATSKSTGDIVDSINLPGYIAPGSHTIDVTGVGISGKPVDITQPIFVPYNSDDSDGDGVIDSNDTCPYELNSGEDADRDGIDDTCDNFIGPAGSGTSQPKPPLTPAASFSRSLFSPTASHAKTMTVPPKHVSASSQVLSAKASQSKTLRNSGSSADTANSAAPFGYTLIIGLLSCSLIIFAAFFIRGKIIKSSSFNSSGLCNNLAAKSITKISAGVLQWVNMRKFGLAVFALIFFVSLLVLGFSTSSNAAFTHPAKMQQWLNESNLYGAFVENAINQAEKTAGTDQSGGVSLSDTVVKQAALSSFSSVALSKDVTVFLNSNYAWLEGKTNTPDFKIDLTGAKQSFAIRVGNYVRTYLAGLPICSATQLAQISPQTTDPLTLQCRPPNVNPVTEGAFVTHQIASSNDFLSNPVITAANINPNGSATARQPYYQKFASLPKIYQRMTKLPIIAAVLTLLSLVAVIFLAPRKRNSLKIIAAALALAGFVMVAAKFISDQVFSTIENRIFNATTVGELQRALTNFFHHAESQLVRVDLWFGIVYLIVAAIIVIVLISTRPRGIRIPKPLRMPASQESGDTDDNNNQPVSPAPSPKTGRTAPVPKPKPKSPPSRPRRLVQ